MLLLLGEVIIVDINVFCHQGELMLSHHQERRIKHIQEESIKIQELYVKSPFLDMNDESWKELKGLYTAHGIENLQLWELAEVLGLKLELAPLASM